VKYRERHAATEMVLLDSFYPNNGSLPDLALRISKRTLSKQLNSNKPAAHLEEIGFYDIHTSLEDKEIRILNQGRGERFPGGFLRRIL